MPIYNREGLIHRKVVTSSVGYRVSGRLPSSAKGIRGKSGKNASAMYDIIGQFSGRTLESNNEKSLGNRQLDIRNVEQTPSDFISVSKPSEAIDNLLRKRSRNQDDAIRNMRRELAESYAACEDEFRNRSVSVKIRINYFRKEIDDIGDKLREINLLDLRSNDRDEAFEKVSVLINCEKETVHRFYRDLLNIEKKRREYVTPILRKYYKLFHKISFFLPYETQVYLENEILNYNEAVLGNYRIYADLHLQMNLLADAAKIGFKDLVEELKSDSRKALGIEID